MSALKLFSVLALLAAISMTGCKSKTAKELIVGKWQVTAITDDGAEADRKMSDAEKKELVESTSIEFTSDGKCTVNSREGAENGTYTLSEDGKTLMMKQSGSDRNDEMQVSELGGTKLVLLENKSKMKLTFTKK